MSGCDCTEMCEFCRRFPEIIMEFERENGRPDMQESAPKDQE